MTERPLDEKYDCQRDVERDPYGAWMAIQSLSAALSAAQPMVKDVPPGLIDALRSYGQADAHGTMCIVSRQAVEEATAILSALEPRE